MNIVGNFLKNKNNINKLNNLHFYLKKYCTDSVIKQNYMVFNCTYKNFFYLNEIYENENGVIFDKRIIKKDNEVISEIEYENNKPKLKVYKEKELENLSLQINN